MSDEAGVRLTHDELKGLIADSIKQYDSASPRLVREDIEVIIEDSVTEMMTRLGLDHEDPIGIQKDFARLREWRLASERLKTKSMMTIMGIVLAGGVAALWVGFKIMVGKTA